MILRCLTGHIGYGGDIYATGDVFEVDDPMVMKSLIDDADAELVDGGDSKELPKVDDVVTEALEDKDVVDNTTKISRKKKVNRQ